MNFIKFIKKEKRIIYHAGAWAGNFGDSILEQSIKNNLVKCTNKELDFRYINCQKTEFTKELIDQMNNEGDMLLIGGGGLVFFRPQDNSKSGWQWNIDINLIDEIKVPIVVYGIGYNQFEFDTSNFLHITNKHLQKTVEKARLFSVRNTGTKNELIKRGCNGNKIEVIPDCGMFLPARSIQIPCIDNEKLKVAINWTTDRENQTFPEPFPETKESFIDILIDLFNYLIENENAQIFYIGHMCESFDRDIIDTLERRLVNAPIVIDRELSDIYPPAAEKAGYIVDIYRQMDIVYGMRGHANIVSFGQNTPFIGIGSHPKIRYFLSDIGREKYFFDARKDKNEFNFEKAKELTLDILNNYEGQKRNMDIEYKRQKEILRIFNKKVIRLL